MIQKTQNREEIGIKEIGQYLTEVAKDEDNVTVNVNKTAISIKNSGSEFMDTVVDSVLRLSQFEETNTDAHFPPMEPLNGELREIRVPHNYIEDRDTYVARADLTTIKSEEAFEQFKENIGVVKEEIIEKDITNRLRLTCEDGTILQSKEPVTSELGVDIGRISIESESNEMIYKIRDDLICKTNHRKCSYRGGWFNIIQKPN